METGDPDDFLRLLLLPGHPGVNLKAVTPGTPAEVGLVRRALRGSQANTETIDAPRHKRC